MKTELFLVTFGRDYDFAECTLRSIRKFGSGFAGITIVVPIQDQHRFEQLGMKYGCTIRSFFEAHGKGFLHHQVVKCEADLWCPRDTDVICHIDSDCVFKEPFTPETFMYDGRLILCREHFEDFRQYAARYSWKHCVDYALGVNIEWETMVRHPSVFWKDMYPRMRAHIEQRHHYPFTQYVLLQRNEFPQSFAEFPTIGGYALLFEPERYQCVTQLISPGPYWNDPKWAAMGIVPVKRDASHRPIGDLPDQRNLWHYHDGTESIAPLTSPVQYFWSRGGVTPEYRAKIEALLAR